MRVGIVSDSHGEIENLRKAARWLIDNQKWFEDNYNIKVRYVDRFGKNNLLISEISKYLK